jgi:hypothetical protein
MTPTIAYADQHAPYEPSSTIWLDPLVAVESSKTDYIMTPTRSIDTHSETEIEISELVRKIFTVPTSKRENVVGRKFGAWEI